MKEELGESLREEWNREQWPGELWDALQLLKVERAQGIAMLSVLSERGSPLAMMHLGHTLSLRGSPDEQDLAEVWLSRSANAGSIEGRLQLAIHFKRQKSGAKAVQELMTLMDRGYAPAMYLLGQIFYFGTLVDRDVDRAVHCFNHAKRAGHIPALGALSVIYRKEAFGVRATIAAHWNFLTKIPSAIRLMRRYPNSDRLRGMAREKLSF